MTLDLRIQAAAKGFRDGTLAGMSENDVRSIAEDLGIDGHETTPLVTLREEIVQQWRDDARAATYDDPQLATNPGTEGSEISGNPGNDNATLPSFPAP